jgi:hypothetical protein
VKTTTRQVKGRSNRLQIVSGDEGDEWKRTRRTVPWARACSIIFIERSPGS